MRQVDSTFNRKTFRIDDPGAPPDAPVSTQNAPVPTVKKKVTNPAQSLLGKTLTGIGAGATANTQVKGAGGTTPGTGTGGFYSPALENLKHSYLTQDYNKMPEFYGDIYGSLKNLTQRVDEPVGTSERERQAVYNLAQRQHAGALATAKEAMREKLGGVGWKVGESGIADSIMAKMEMEGAEQMGQKATEIAINERDRRFKEAMELENLNLNRTMGAGSLGAMLRDTYLGQKGLGLNALQTGGGLEQFAKNYQQNASQFGASMGLSRDKFQYQQEMDALDRLMGLGGYGQNQQATAWQPYWSAVAGA